MLKSFRIKILEKKETKMRNLLTAHMTERSNYNINSHSFKDCEYYAKNCAKRISKIVSKIDKLRE